MHWSRFRCCVRHAGQVLATRTCARTGVRAWTEPVRWTTCQPEGRPGTSTSIPPALGRGSCGAGRARHRDTAQHTGNSSSGRRRPSPPAAIKFALAAAEARGPGRTVLRACGMGRGPGRPSASGNVRVASCRILGRANSMTPIRFLGDSESDTDNQTLRKELPSFVSTTVQCFTPVLMYKLFKISFFPKIFPLKKHSVQIKFRSFGFCTSLRTHRFEF